MTEPRRRVDQNEAFFPIDSDLACDKCGQGCGDFHEPACPRNAYDTIAEVNGVPVLVEFEHGGYAAPHGLEGIVEYLEAPGGVHDCLDDLYDRLLEKENKRKRAVDARVQAEAALEGAENTIESMATALQDCADLLRHDSYTHRERVNLADNIETYLLKDLSARPNTAIHTDGHKDGGFGISDPDVLRDLRDMIDQILSLTDEAKGDDDE